jgi:hypothetical protein
MLALAIPGLSIPIELYDAVDEWVTTTSTLVARLTEAPT